MREDCPVRPGSFCEECKFSLCLRGFLPQSNSLLTGFRLLGNSELAVGVNGCLSLFDPVMHW